MEVQILEVIKKYIQENKQIDNNFIETIVEIVVDYNQLNNYVKKIQILDHKPSDCRAEYFNFTHKINFYMINIKKWLDVIKRENQLNLNENESRYFDFCYICRIILHEIEHANQEKKLNEYICDIETRLIALSFYPHKTVVPYNFDSKVLNKLYHEYYTYNPTERLAEIYAFQTLKNIFEPIQNQIPNISDYLVCKKQNRVLQGYNLQFKNKQINNIYSYVTRNHINKTYIDMYNYFCAYIYDYMLNERPETIITYPTTMWLYGMKLQKEWKCFPFYSSNEQQLIKNAQTQFPLEKRLSLGLPISNDEYFDFLKSHNKTS